MPLNLAAQVVRDWLGHWDRPGVDVNQFAKIVTQTALIYTVKHLLADAGYDSEANHRLVRETFHIRTTIPPKHGRPTLTLKPLTGKYHERMRTHFDRRTYGQRWQVETIVSMIKRNQGD